jgi:mono/diheme cytochrome c family protein
MSRLLAVSVAATLLMAAPRAFAAGTQSADVAKGEQVFKAWCLPCHGKVGPGTYMLEKRLGKDESRIDHRTNLTGDYIRYVVRNGLNGMLPFRMTEVTDGELKDVIDYLTRNNGKHSGSN